MNQIEQLMQAGAFYFSADPFVALLQFCVMSFGLALLPVALCFWISRRQRKNKPNERNG